MRSQRTENQFANSIYRAQRRGLIAAEVTILRALDAWFNDHADGPTVQELAQRSGFSHTMVYWTLPVLEALGYITVNRHRSGRRIARSIRLWVDMADVRRAG